MYLIKNRVNTYFSEYVKYRNEIIFATMKPKIALMQVYSIFAYLQYVINAL